MTHQPEKARPPGSGPSPKTTSQLASNDTQNIVERQRPVHHGLAVAHALAKAGVKVFPCVRSSDPKRDKKPLTANGFKNATTDPAQIERWWNAHPDARVGVPTGPATGLFVLDADVDKDTGEPIGERNLLRLGFDVVAHPWKQRTQRGGWHFFFKWDEGCPGNTASKIAKGVDTRSDRGYFIAYDPDAVLEAVEALHG